MSWGIVSFADGADADRVPTSYRRDSTGVSGHRRIKVKLAPGGGWAARISLGAPPPKRDGGGVRPGTR
jgi:alpha-glucosidase